MQTHVRIPTSRGARHRLKAAKQRTLRPHLTRLMKRMTSVEGWLTESEATGLYNTTRRLTPPIVAVEIGSWHGKSSIMIAGGICATRGQGALYALDPFVGADGYAEGRSPSPSKTEFLDRFRNNVRAAGLERFVIPVKGYSHDIVRTWKRPIDFLFIDGDHQYEQVIRDFEDWSPHVKKGGFIAFHDTYTWPGPTRVVQDSLRPPDWKVTLRADSLTVAQRVRAVPVPDPLPAMSESQHYTALFFEQIRPGSRRSAQVLLPVVKEMLCPKSVVDVGCGVGTWLAVFRELGVADVVGIDGEYVDRALLEIPQEQFVELDLSAPFSVDRTFDLAICLEVAEHLPPEAAEAFVESVARLAPIVLFSAAIPFQGGNHHLNEQWPDYWATLFRRHNYVAIDCIRGKIWDNHEVEPWYVQNSLIFADTSFVQKDGVLRTAFEATNLWQLSMVHPRSYLAKVNSRPSSSQYGVRKALDILVHSLKNATYRRIQHLLDGDGLAR